MMKQNGVHARHAFTPSSLIGRTTCVYY